MALQLLYLTGKAEMNNKLIIYVVLAGVSIMSFYLGVQETSDQETIATIHSSDESVTSGQQVIPFKGSDQNHVSVPTVTHDSSISGIDAAAEDIPPIERSRGEDLEKISSVSYSDAVEYEPLPTQRYSLDENGNDAAVSFSPGTGSDVGAINKDGQAVAIQLVPEESISSELFQEIELTENRISRSDGYYAMPVVHESTSGESEANAMHPDMGKQ